ncbi:MAG: hypothetical protein NTY15_15100 [Planctomycetota bacterium]|nr:hypothetical protein [Planctomycetota bacterium]
MKFNRKHHKSKNEAFVGHYRLLGLKRGECRTNVIRSAAQSLSSALSYNGSAGDQGKHSADDVQRARIALAAYRLLDPRERADVYERVQLCYPIDREDAEYSTPSVGKLVDQMVQVPAMSRRQTKSMVKLMGQPVIDEAIEGNLPADEEPEAAEGNLSAEKSNSDPSLEERRRIVRLMREFDESTHRSLSPIGWLRSRLGF